MIPTSYICVTQAGLERQLNLKLQNTKIAENTNISVELFKSVLIMFILLLMLKRIITNINIAVI